MQKHVLNIRSASELYWVGDGFPVRNFFDYNGTEVAARSPFLMLDYAAPTEFTPNLGARRGVGAHPHRGFETVTIVYDGEVEHRDSTGAGGVIGRGDVQWMTAGGGIIHEEFHAENFSRTGGAFEMVQLWINLPQAHKMTPANYQSIQAAHIPNLALPDAAGRLRVIAGEYGEHRGAAKTYTPMNVWDIGLNQGQSVNLDQPEGWSTLIVLLAGELMVNEQSLQAMSVATLSHEASGVQIQAQQTSKLLLLAGEPMAEAVVGYGPFVMNSRAEIAQAIHDFNNGQFTGLQPKS